MKTWLTCLFLGTTFTTPILAADQPEDLDISPSGAFQKGGCQKVWSGVPARIRIYDQPTSTGRKVFLYVGTGSTFDYVGWTDRDNIFQVVKEAMTQSSLTGYTNSSCKIEWVDYRGL